MGINTEDCVHLNNINLILAEKKIAWLYFQFETIVMRITFFLFLLAESECMQSCVVLHLLLSSPKCCDLFPVADLNTSASN